MLGSGDREKYVFPIWEAEVKYQEFPVLLWQPKRREVASGFTVGMGAATWLGWGRTPAKRFSVVGDS